MKKVNITVDGICCQYDGKKMITNPALSVKAKVGKLKANLNREQNKIR